MTKLFKIRHLTLEKTLYPRDSVNREVVDRYVEELQAGAQFPPITVAEKNKKFYILDGMHRTESRKKIGETTIEAEVVKLPKSRWFAEAKALTIKLNTGHGSALTSKDRVRAISELKKLKFSLTQISKIVHIPVTSLTEFVKVNKISYKPLKVSVKQPTKFPSGRGVYLNRLTGTDKYESVKSVQYDLLTQLVSDIQDNGLEKSSKALAKKLKKLL